MLLKTHRDNYILKNVLPSHMLEIGLGNLSLPHCSTEPSFYILIKKEKNTNLVFQFSWTFPIAP